MCLTTPLQIKDLVGTGQVKLSDGRVANLGFSAKVAKDDWVLVNADLAVAKVSPQEAKEIKNFLK